MGKSVTKSFNGGKLAAKDYIDWIIVFMKKQLPQGVVCPCPGAIYMYMTIIFKHLLLWNRLANQRQISFGASLGRGKESVYNWSRSLIGPGHMTKMAAMPIYDKNLQKSSPTELIVYDLETWHGALCTQALQSLYKWWLWVDLDLFYDNVKFCGTCFYTYSRPRYQVSVYRTIGPLVYTFK